MLKRHNGIKVALGRAARLLPRQREPCRAHIFWVINISARNVYAKAAVAPAPGAPARPWCRWVGEHQPSASLCAACSGEKRPTQRTRVRKGRGSQRCRCSALIEKLMVLLGGCWGEMLRWEGTNPCTGGHGESSPEESAAESVLFWVRSCRALWGQALPQTPAWFGHPV